MSARPRLRFVDEIPSPRHQHGIEGAIREPIRELRPAQECGKRVRRQPPRTRGCAGDFVLSPSSRLLGSHAVFICAVASVCPRGPLTNGSTQTLSLKRSYLDRVPRIWLLEGVAKARLAKKLAWVPYLHRGAFYPVLSRELFLPYRNRDHLPGWQRSSQDHRLHRW
jgi:hypothetical protein